MLGGGKESILDGVFRVCCVPQEPKSPLIKHRQVARHDAVQFLSTLANNIAANCSISFNECSYCRHHVSPLQATPTSAIRLMCLARQSYICRNLVEAIEQPKRSATGASRKSLTLTGRSGRSGNSVVKCRRRCRHLLTIG